MASSHIPLDDQLQQLIIREPGQALVVLQNDPQLIHAVAKDHSTPIDLFIRSNKVWAVLDLYKRGAAVKSEKYKDTEEKTKVVVEDLQNHTAEMKQSPTDEKKLNELEIKIAKYYLLHNADAKESEKWFSKALQRNTPAGLKVAIDELKKLATHAPPLEWAKRMILDAKKSDRPVLKLLAYRAGLEKEDATALFSKQEMESKNYQNMLNLLDDWSEAHQAATRFEKYGKQFETEIRQARLRKDLEKFVSPPTEENLKSLQTFPYLKEDQEVVKEALQVWDKNFKLDAQAKAKMFSEKFYEESPSTKAREEQTEKTYILRFKDCQFNDLELYCLDQTIQSCLNKVEESKNQKNYNLNYHSNVRDMVEVLCENPHLNPDKKEEYRKICAQIQRQFFIAWKHYLDTCTDDPLHSRKKLLKTFKNYLTEERKQKHPEGYQASSCAFEHYQFVKAKKSITDSNLYELAKKNSLEALHYLAKQNVEIKEGEVKHKRIDSCERRTLSLYAKAYVIAKCSPNRRFFCEETKAVMDEAPKYFADLEKRSFHYQKYATALRKMIEGIKEEEIADPDAYIFTHLDQNYKTEYEVGLSQGMGDKNNTKWADVYLSRSKASTFKNYAVMYSSNAAHVASNDNDEDETLAMELPANFTTLQHQ